MGREKDNHEGKVFEICEETMSILRAHKLIEDIGGDSVARVTKKGRAVLSKLIKDYAATRN